MSWGAVTGLQAKRQPDLTSDCMETKYEGYTAFYRPRSLETQPMKDKKKKKKCFKIAQPPEDELISEGKFSRRKKIIS